MAHPIKGAAGSLDMAVKENLSKDIIGSIPGIRKSLVRIEGALNGEKQNAKP